MIRFDWNALRVGDLVQVHDPPFPPSVATTGEVTLVKVHGHGTNEVAIRLFDRDRTVVWPVLTTVHRGSLPGDRSCWRCRALFDDLAVEPPSDPQVLT